MYDQVREDTLYIMLYAVVTAMAIQASCYLLFRRANAIAPNVTPPARLRRWAAAFFVAFALNHIWYMPIFFLSSREDIMMTDLIGGLLDSMTVFPLMIVVLLTMLQDRRRPLWPVAVMFAPLAVGSAWCVATLSYDLLPIIYSYFLLTCIGFIIYMVRALKQYGRWLRDNYADLEHKEVWQSFLVLAIVLLVFVVYAFTNEGPIYQYAMQVICLVFISYFLWRVETLSDLSISQPLSINEETVTTDEMEGDGGLPQTIRDSIGPRLKRFCEEGQLYLQYDISLPQLAHTIGTNRFYLSRHFSSQGMTYNAYINGLRIRHFVNLYHEKAATNQLVSAQQLAYQSGFRSYSTFSAAFKQIMGMTATEWMRSLEE